MIDRRRLEEVNAHVAASLDRALPVLLDTTERVGFVMLLFEFGVGGQLAYASNGDREHMIQVVEEWLAHVKAGRITDPPGPRAKA